MFRQIICFLLLTASAASLVLLSSQAYADENLSEKLIELRSEVQNTADELETQKKSLNASVQSLTVEKGELESRKKLLNLQNNEMEKTLVKKEKISGGLELKSLEGYSEVVTEGLNSLLNYYKLAIPFKFKDRTEKAKSLLSKFKQKEITVAEYFEKYWAMVQDEIRLSENVEIQNDNIKIGETEYQVKVLKLGMYQMYFKTYDGKTGYAQNQNGEWTFNFFKNSSFSKGVNLLFVAKEKQINGGNFELPIVKHNSNQNIGLNQLKMDSTVHLHTQSSDQAQKEVQSVY